MSDSPIHRDSHEWPKLKRWLEANVRELQRQLEDVTGTVPEASHNITRGRIAAFRDLLLAVEPDKRLEAQELQSPSLEAIIDY